MNNRPWLLALSFLVFVGCQRPQPEAEAAREMRPGGDTVKRVEKGAPAMARLSDLDHILEALHSNDEKTREAAKSDLFRLRHKSDSLTVAQGLTALRAAAQPYRFEKPAFEEISESLVDVVAQNPRAEYVPVVIQLFDKFSDKAKWWALAILARLESQDAALAYMAIIRQHAKAGRIPRLVTGPLEQKPRHVDVFFPELLHYATVPHLSDDVYRLCLAYCEAGVLFPEIIAPVVGQVLGHYRALAGKLRPAQRSQGVGWMWEEPYSSWRFHAGLLLDLLGHFPAAAVEAEIRSALEYRDPRLKYFALASLLRLGKAVDAKHVAGVAAHGEMRNWLYERLRKHNQQTLYPEKFRTQTAFAEADMINWLTYPTELGRVPDEIELMKVVPVDTGLPGGVYDYYLFRFRTHEPHWAAKDGWMAGVAGPFRRNDQPTTASLGDTFSTFTKWDSKMPEEHVGNIRELMVRWRGYHADHQK